MSTKQYIDILKHTKKLMQQGIVSAPVFDEESKKFVGLVDSLDILACIVELFEDVEQQGATIFSRLETGSKFSAKTIGEVTDFAHNPYTPIGLEQSLYDACKLFIKDGSHRCPVVNEKGEVISILTMSAVLNSLASHPGCLGELGKQTVAQLDLGTKPVITVEKQLRTIDAFKKLHEHKISGVAVVDSQNKLIGNLSARDLKSIDSSNIYSSMYISTNAFVQHIRQNSVEEVHPAISCLETTTFDYVLGKLAANRIHRLYVCDKDFHPQRVISLRDIIRSLLGHE